MISLACHLAKSLCSGTSCFGPGIFVLCCRRPGVLNRLEERIRARCKISECSAAQGSYDSRYTARWDHSKLFQVWNANPFPLVDQAEQTKIRQTIAELRSDAQEIQNSHREAKAKLEELNASYKQLKDERVNDVQSITGAIDI